MLDNGGRNSNCLAEIEMIKIRAQLFSDNGDEAEYINQTLDALI